ncbi:uncharacterized protein [Diabrotica undecimpunctata]|uniref:uncharacterized protein n=1 Tax=Diabrotica undecimpunctata TaxID=50387 RepID=UPI003B63330B
MEMEWSKLAVIEFLNLYENERVLWDPSHKLHKNSHEVHDAWKRIQTEFSLKKSVGDLKKKKDTLMGCFRKCLSKIKASERSGVDTDGIYKPTWFAFDIMARFLIHYNTPLDDTPNETIHLENIKLENITEEHDSYIENETEYDDISNILVSSAEPSILTTKRKATSDDSINEMTKISKITQDIIYDKMENAYDIFQKTSQLREKDECDLFGELVAKRLRALGQHERDYLMHQMENMMYQAKMRSSQHIVLVKLIKFTCSITDRPPCINGLFQLFAVMTIS